ncbi:hypothetical protein HF086_013370 [Spodoptera exigua]|uniref:Uncharacterized protein n=1 Tax=Spodoptera exigua TaxID=7107 RepID=A0A922MK17_SPOEX|nr:hypothetical protein HF086_013370 [Spodoptera exigua]
MKTLVVVSALVSLAIAAPTLPEDGTESRDTTLNLAHQAKSTLLENLTKERTPTETAPVTLLHNGAPTTDFLNTQISNDGTSMPMARSFLLKKPLIVKKKYGYKLYRDSEEEKAQADSNETCGRQVKVKLCDENEKYRASMVSTDGNVDIHSSDDDVKHSIKMAKEAVENLQRDLKKMEMKTEMKTAHDSQSDVELHEDIEVARKALEHIHDNFENLETMSLRATATRNSEDMHDVHLTIAKTEEERMAQWKEALENIQKNVEIARNIEDSFKTANTQEDMVHLDQSNAASTFNNRMDETALLSETDQLRLAHGVNLEVHNQERTTKDEKPLEKTMHENMDELIARKTVNVDDDMNFAPSEMIEVHLDNNKHHETLKSESHKIAENAKSAEPELEDSKTVVEKNDLKNLQQFEDHNVQEKSAKLNMETLESIPTDASTKPLTFVPVSEQQRTVELNENGTEIQNQQEKVKETDSDDISDFILRSAFNTEESKLTKEDIGNEHMVAKDTEGLNPEQKEFLTETWDLKAKEALPTPHNEIKHFDTMPKSTETLENKHFLMRDNEHAEREKFIQDQLRQQWMQREELNQMETLQAMRTANDNRLQNQKTIFWPQAQSHKNFEHLPSMKAAEDFDQQFETTHGELEQGFVPENAMDHFRSSYVPEHIHMPSKMGSHVSDLSHSHHHSHYPSRYHQNSMTHQHMHEMAGMGSAMHPHFLPHMRDAMDGFESEHTFHWQPTHESARTAYGASGLSSSVSPSGAVGVFPNANVGGCGIPLLLSCSPSVVSGSLAKAHSAGPSSYSAPQYRMEEDFNFLTKRGINMNDMRTTNTMRAMTTALKQNTPKTLENKA